MNIWYASIPAFIPGTPIDRQGVIIDTPDGMVVLDGDGTDPTRVASFDPTGTLGFTPNHGPYELMSVDPSINVLRYTGSGVAFAVPYRAR